MMQTIPFSPVQLKDCLCCGKKIKGRSDKKFCDDYCRNAFNNQLNANSNNYIRNINSQLRKNRRILEQLINLNEKSKKVRKDQLLRAGYLFQYHTHTITEKGNMYFFCYEYGYLLLEQDLCLLFKNKGNM